MSQKNGERDSMALERQGQSVQGPNSDQKSNGQEMEVSQLDSEDNTACEDTSLLVDLLDDGGQDLGMLEQLEIENIINIPSSASWFDFDEIH